MGEINRLVEFIRDYYQTKDFIPLHAPVFKGKEEAYVTDTIKSTFVSSVGGYVDKFEQQISDYTGASRAIATVNGTAALHAALYLAGVQPGDLVITQALTFVATCNVISMLGASAVFIDVNKENLGLCPVAVGDYLSSFAELDDKGECRHKQTGQRISAVVPMHTFGHPVDLDGLINVCTAWHLPLVEDAAESLGSFYKERHTGTLGVYGALSFNGNKIITTGGGGMILTRDEASGKRAKHITTTAKVPHPYEFYHDEMAFNYRMPNLNAALGCAQLEQLDSYLKIKRELAQAYKQFFAQSSYQFVDEPDYAHSNFWLNAVICADERERNRLLETTNSAGVMTRPVWTLMHKLPMYQSALKGTLENSEWLESRVVNIPSSVPEKMLGAS